MALGSPYWTKYIHLSVSMSHLENEDSNVTHFEDWQDLLKWITIIIINMNIPDSEAKHDVNLRHIRYLNPRLGKTW